MRELEFSSPIDISVVEPGELADRLRDANERDLDLARLEAEGRRLGLLGVIPPELAGRYLQFVDELLAEQVAGFYDPTTKELVVGRPAGSTGRLDAITQLTTVHEMVHALTDQEFDYGPLTDALYKALKDDELGAAVAVIEGDAVLAQNLFAQELDPADLRNGLGDLPPSPVFDSAPRFINDSLLFPYVEGAAFVDDVWTDGGYRAVDRLYREFPTTTEQILHRDRYEKKEGALAVELPGLDLGQGWSQATASDLGEFTLRLILRDAMDDGKAEAGAAGWGGDRYAQYHNGAATLVAFRIRGDSPQAAANIHQALTVFLDDWRNEKLGSSKLAIQGDTITMVLSTDQGALDAASRNLGI